MNLTRLARTAAVATLLAFVPALPAGAFVVPPADEVQPLVEMPLAVTRVVEVGLPEPEVEAIVVDLNRYEVPAYQSVELLRYAPLDLFLDDPLGLGVDLGLDLGGGDPILLVLLAEHIDAGLVGLPLADAVFLDLERVGIPLVERRTTRTVVREPIVLTQRFVPFDPGDRIVRDGDRIVVRDRDGRVVVRDRDRDGTLVRARIRDRDYVAVPPGHAKHGPGGPHPTPGHVKHHDGPDAKPGHARGGPGRKAPKAKQADQPGKGKGHAKAKARDDGPGKGKGKAKGQGKGRGKGKGKGDGAH